MTILNHLKRYFSFFNKRKWVWWITNAPFRGRIEKNKNSIWNLKWETTTNNLAGQKGSSLGYEQDFQNTCCLKRIAARHLLIRGKEVKIGGSSVMNAGLRHKNVIWLARRIWFWTQRIFRTSLWKFKIILVNLNPFRTMSISNAWFVIGKDSRRNSCLISRGLWILTCEGPSLARKWRQA